MNLKLAFLIAVFVPIPAHSGAAPPPALKTIYDHLYGAYGGLLQLPSGELCGTDERSVYELVPPAMPSGAWTKNALVTFTGANGMSSKSGVVMDSAGNLYGTVGRGTRTGNGGVYRLKPPATPGGAWTEEILYSFAGLLDGAVPVGGLVFGPKGELYGTTTAFGAWNLGTAFVLAPPAAPGGAWKETPLYSFGSHATDGGSPLAALIIDKNGNLYGTNGGARFRSLTGTVFELSPPKAPGGAWTETLLFDGSPSEVGEFPVGPVTMDAEGSLYGTTFAGGINNNYCSAGCGTVFKLTPPASGSGAWSVTVVYSFTGGNGGAQPYSGVLIAPDGTLYGTTEFGGINNYGTFYWLTPPAQPGASRSETALPLNVANGYPLAGVILGKNGALYGNSQTNVFQIER